MTANLQNPFETQRETILATLWQFLQRNTLTLIGLCVIFVALVVTVIAPLITPYGPLEQDMMSRLQSPSLRHPMGTDALGRDILSRVIYGGRISLPVAAVIVIVSMVIGITLGSLAGFFGGFLDDVLMRFTDLMMGFPPMILAMFVASALGPGIIHSALAVILVWWPAYARLLRSQVLSVKKNTYVLASESIGSSKWRILRRTVLPNCMGPVVVLATLDMGSAILTFASLSFLGLGTTPPTPEWGAMVGKGIYYFDQWWISTFPGLAIFFTALAFNLVGDGLRDALDPRLWQGR
jgi:peptide/nickel transport system permease protein